MKKVVSLLLALVVCMALTAPTFALKNIGPDVIFSGEETISDTFIMVYGDVIIESDASITFCGSLRISNGQSAPTNFTINPGATVTVNGNLYIYANSELNIGGVLMGKCSIPCYQGSLNLLPGGTVDLEVVHENEANDIAEILSEYGATVENIQDGDYKYRVTAHVHDFSKGDCPCGEKAPTGSVLSKGYPEIVYVIGGLAVAAVVVLVIVKKKKPAAANGANSGDEE